jgi:hypothetical protein
LQQVRTIHAGRGNGDKEVPRSDRRIGALAPNQFAVFNRHCVHAERPSFP